VVAFLGEWLSGQGGYVVAASIGFLFGSWLTARELRRRTE
jgi:hypothetical protein